MAPEALNALTKQELMALVLVLAEQNRVLAAQVAALQARIAELDARLGPPKTPDNSSLPPSRCQKADRSDKAAKPGGPVLPASLPNIRTRCARWLPRPPRAAVMRSRRATRRRG